VYASGFRVQRAVRKVQGAEFMVDLRLIVYPPPPFPRTLAPPGVDEYYINIPHGSERFLNNAPVANSSSKGEQATVSRAPSDDSPALPSNIYI
jgi:hypothetical protein